LAASAPNSGFAQALEAHPAPRRLGDVALRYEPSMLIGEADRPPRTPAAATALVAALAVGLATVGAALLDVGDGSLLALGVTAAATFALTIWLEQRDRRQRRFVCNFETNSLRLDFSTPIAGRPRTLVVHFDGVRALGVLAQGDGRFALAVDFVPAPEAPGLLREVLVAHVPARALEELERLERVLHGAFGLGSPAPAAAPANAPPIDRFEPR
jgi:hypothetical protein